MASPSECEMDLVDCPYDHGVSDVAQQACVQGTGFPQPASTQDAATVSAAPTVTATTFLVWSSHLSVMRDVELGQALVLHQ
jgi:hypothetical protein